MEIVKIILNFIAEPNVIGFIVLGISLVIIQRRKILVKRLEMESIKDTNATSLKIAREKNKTDIKLAQLQKEENSPSNSMSRAS